MSVTRKASGPASQSSPSEVASTAIGTRRSYGVNCSSSFQPLSMNCESVRCVTP